MPGAENKTLAALVESIRKSPKYRELSIDLIRHIGLRELGIRRNLKEATKATKNKLHQVAGAYLSREMSYEKWLAELKIAAASGDEIAYKDICRRIMQSQSSTAERLRILEEFYGNIFSAIPQVHTILDIACGLNPLSLPWMPLKRNAQYYAFEIYEDMVRFINGFLELSGVSGKAEVRDVIHDFPSTKGDLALILKSLPCLEQEEKNSALALLESLNVDYLVVSFPLQSLGGYSKSMALNYEMSFRRMIESKTWSVQRFEFANELAFLVTK